MAKSTVRIAETEEEATTRQAAEEMADLNHATGDKLFTVIEEIRGSAAASGTKCLVTRIASDGKSGGYCGTIAVADFTLDKVKSLYGPGKYTVQIKGPKGFLPGGTGIEIADTGESTPSPTPKTGGDFMTYLEFMQKQEESRREKSNRLLELGIPALGTIIAAILNRPQGTDVAALVSALKPAPGPSLADLTTAMVNMRTLNAPSAGSDPLDMILKVFEAAHDMAGGGGGKGEKSGWIDLARDALKGLPAVAGPFVQALRGRSGAPQPASITANTAPPLAAPSVTALETSAEPSAELAPPSSVGDAAGRSGDNMLALMKPFAQQKLKLISQWANEKKNPQLYAELFLTEHVPSNLSDYLPPEKALEYLNHAQWFEKTIEWEPALANHRAWCDTFRLELIEMIQIALQPQPGDGAVAADDIGVTDS